MSNAFALPLEVSPRGNRGTFLYDARGECIGLIEGDDHEERGRQLVRAANGWDATQRMREQIIREWEQTLNTVEEADEKYEESEQQDQDWLSIYEGGIDTAMVLYRIATAGGIELPNVPKWIHETKRMQE